MSSTVYLTGMYLTISLVFVWKCQVCVVLLFVIPAPVGKQICSVRIDRILRYVGLDWLSCQIILALRIFASHELSI